MSYSPPQSHARSPKPNLSTRALTALSPSLELYSNKLVRRKCGCTKPFVDFKSYLQRSGNRAFDKPKKKNRTLESTSYPVNLPLRSLDIIRLNSQTRHRARKRFLYCVHSSIASAPLSLTGDTTCRPGLDVRSALPKSSIGSQVLCSKGTKRFVMPLSLLSLRLSKVQQSRYLFKELCTVL